MSESILLVDDAAFMRVILRAVLQKAGYQIVGEAENGADAVNLYSELKPDLVIMDLFLPVIDGVQATFLIRKLDPEAKVVICSALDEREMAVKAIQAGAADIIVKPFLESRVLDTVRMALGKRASHCQATGSDLEIRPVSLI